MRGPAPGATASQRLPQPGGLGVLFITEMWERFSYYGMRALLVLYLIASTSEVLPDGRPNANPGFGWSEEAAFTLYGIYTWAVYLTPIFGGWLADRFLGTHRSMLIGGWIIAAGHTTLALTELSGVTAGQAVTLQTSPAALVTFIAGLALIVIGTGFFKPCVSVMVGQLYAENDPRRDSGFTIFYMGINLGALLSPFVAGTLGEVVGWHWGFGAAAVGMLLGLFFYQVLRPRYLPGIGLAPREQARWDAAKASDPADPLERGTEPPRRVVWQRIAVILVLAFVGNIFFWTAFEQAGSSLNVFAKLSTDRSIGALFGTGGFPASWYQSVNPLTILIFAPAFAWLWVALDRRGRDPSTPMKFCLGLFLLGLAFIAMVFGATQARESGLADPHWLLGTYVVYTWGELCLSPVGLSMVTKLAPARMQSLMMGLWFFSFSLANLFGGLVARFSKRLESGELTFVLDGLPGFYLMLVLAPILAGLFLLLLTPTLERMMHGVK
jgi:POT family proton-dependent oligopeptide transporter